MLSMIPVAVAASALFGPPEGPPPSPRIDLVGPASAFCLLLENRKMAEELKLDESQVARCAALVERTRERMEATRDARAARQSGDRDRDAPAIENHFSKEFAADIAEILRPEQLARLRQIGLQAGTAATLLNPSVRAELGLDDRQVARIKAIHEEGRTTFLAELRARKITQKDLPRRALALRVEGRRRALAELSADQRSTWEAMIGEPFYREAELSKGSEPGNPTLAPATEAPRPPA